ncbi:hypothetical protein F0562_003713 [Nyssa sinensis]|uniref:Uncharacterized protein n=1 Tax=Nyssa sinensis TaxID=561372 RepID=A0A5J5BWC0_9ASTE|nr:hypothetical protein F0562_003713 [Nyssa sinensis]
MIARSLLTISPLESMAALLDYFPACSFSFPFSSNRQLLLQAAALFLLFSLVSRLQRSFFRPQSQPNWFQSLKKALSQFDEISPSFLCAATSVAKSSSLSLDTHIYRRTMARVCAKLETFGFWICLVSMTFLTITSVSERSDQEIQNRFYGNLSLNSSATLDSGESRIAKIFIQLNPCKDLQGNGKTIDIFSIGQTSNGHEDDADSEMTSGFLNYDGHGDEKASIFTNLEDLVNDLASDQFADCVDDRFLNYLEDGNLEDVVETS